MGTLLHNPGDFNQQVRYDVVIMQTIFQLKYLKYVNLINVSFVSFVVLITVQVYTLIFKVKVDNGKVK